MDARKKHILKMKLLVCAFMSVLLLVGGVAFAGTDEGVKDITGEDTGANARDAGANAPDAGTNALDTGADTRNIGANAVSKAGAFMTGAGKGDVRLMFVNGQNVTVWQRGRSTVGANNGYFDVEGATGHGFCCQNSRGQWANNTARTAPATEWDDERVRKAIYYGPDGPGYYGIYFGSRGADFDAATYLCGLSGGDTSSRNRAQEYYNRFLAGKEDPIIWGFRAYRVHTSGTGSNIQDVACLIRSDLPLTITKRTTSDQVYRDWFKRDMPVAGAIFSLWGWDNGTQNYSKAISRATENTNPDGTGNGTYTFSGITRGQSDNPGYFMVREEIAPAGYTGEFTLYNDAEVADDARYGAPHGRVFYLDENGSWHAKTLEDSGFEHPEWGFVFLDHPKEVSVTIYKKETDTEKPLKGAKFELWGYDIGNPDAVHTGDSRDYLIRVGDFTDNGDGSYSITFPCDAAIPYYNLPDITPEMGIPTTGYYYMIKETVSPEKHLLGDENIDPNWNVPAIGFRVQFDAQGEPVVMLPEFPTLHNPRISTPEVKLMKKSADSKVTEGNPCYSLAGAVYGVYKNKDCKKEDLAGTLITDADGESEALEVEEDTVYWVKEIKAPKGYTLDKEAHRVEVKDDTVILELSDAPQMYPVDVFLKKVKKQTRAGKSSHEMPLSHARYEMKYYAAAERRAAEAENPKDVSAVRTWVFETDEDGYCRYDSEHFISGDELYKDEDGAPALPVGVVTIREVKAPEGYLLSDEIFTVEIKGEGTEEGSGIFAAPLASEATLDLEVIKYQKGTKIPISGATFEHTYPGGKETLATGSDGKLLLTALNYGEHSLREIKAADGYTLNGETVTFTVSEDNVITFTSKNTSLVQCESLGAGGSVTFEDEVAPFSLIVHKLNDKGKAVAGARFALYADKDLKSLIKEEETKDDGTIKFAGLSCEVSYWLTETKAPDGYRMPLDEDGNPVVTEIKVKSTPARDIFELYINGKKQETGGAYTLSGTKADRELNMSVTNYVGTRLPATGAGGIIIPTAAGLILLGTVLLMERKNRRKKGGPRS